MNPFMKALIHKLAAQGVRLEDMASFIGSLANSMSFDDYISVDEVNRRLDASGWSGIRLDAHTLELARSCFDLEGVIVSND